MKKQALFSFSLLVVSALACSMLTQNSTPTSVILPSAQPSMVPTLPSPSQEPVASSLPAASPTVLQAPTATALPLPVPSLTPLAPPTPADPMLSTIDKPVNCRFGPGTEYSVIGYFLLGETTRIEGKASDDNWWYIRTPKNPDIFCWVAGSVTAASGDLSQVPVVLPPNVVVSEVSLKLDQTNIAVPGCVFPYQPVTMTGTITTTGPAVVVWHWETSQGIVSADNAIKFTAYGSQDVSDYVKYGAAGNYWVKLVVTGPNSKVAKATYKVTCVP